LSLLTQKTKLIPTTMNKLTAVKSDETTKEHEMTLMLLLSYNKMKLYNENFSNLTKTGKEKKLTL
jgi:hypothetical protein